VERKKLKNARSRVRRINSKLESVYHSPRLGNKKDPLDELFYIMLSLQTTYWSFEKVFDSFKARYPDWDKVRRLKTETIARAIHDAGLSNQKATRLKAILNKLHKDFGKCTLSPLKKMDDIEAEHYLAALPGVGIKTAKCVLMYSLGRSVFPVDSHVYRLFNRLGLSNPSVSFAKAQTYFETLVPEDIRYSLHVNMVAHGRAVCTDRNPNNDQCVIRRHCMFVLDAFRSQYRK